MEKLNKTFIDAQVLSNEELNQMVEKTNELVDASNKVEGIRKAVGFLCGNATFQEGDVLFTSNDVSSGAVITLWIKVPTGTGAVGLFKADGTLIESFGYNSAANAGDGKTADTTITNDFAYAQVINGPVEVISIVSDRINEKLYNVIQGVKEDTAEQLNQLDQEIERIDAEIGGGGGEKLTPITINANLANGATQITSGSSYRLHYIPVKKGSTYYLGVVPASSGSFRYGFSTSIPSPSVSATFIVEFSERYPRYEYKAEADGYLFICHYVQSTDPYTYGGLVTNKDESKIDLSTLTIKQGSLYNGSPSSNQGAIYTDTYIPVSVGQYLVFQNHIFADGKYWRARICAYDENKTFVKNVQADYAYFNHDRVWLVDNYAYIRIALGLTASDGTNLNCTPSDLISGVVLVKQGLEEVVHGNRFDEIDESIAEVSTKVDNVGNLANENKNKIATLFDSIETISPTPKAGRGSSWQEMVVALDKNSNYLLKIVGSYTDASASGSQWFQLITYYDKTTTGNYIYALTNGTPLATNKVFFLPKGIEQVKVAFKIPTTELMNISIERVPTIYDYVEGGDVSYGEDLSAKVASFTSLLASGGDVEPFLFFTDIHNADFSDAFSEIGFNKFMMPIKNVYDALPIDRVICGGDWLNNGDTASGAIKKLSFINRVAHRYFRNYHPMLGNHDTNYQGSGSNAKLSRSVTHSFMFAEYDKNYYSVNGSASKMYFLDTDLDSENWMNAYKNSQMDWFANSLLNDDATNSIVFMHIYMISASAVCEFAKRINLVIDAYNNKTSVAITTDKTYRYDFTNTSGKVKCIIAGHAHIDEIRTSEVVPVVLVTTAKQVDAKGMSTFDLMVANFTENKLHMIRIGNGEDRVVDFNA